MNCRKFVDEQIKILKALAGLTDPEQTRNTITQTFYQDVFGKAVKRARATCLLHKIIAVSMT